MSNTDVDVRVEAAVRRYAEGLARRYAPMLIGGLAALLLVALVPTVNPPEVQPVGGFPAGSASGSTSATPFGAATAPPGAESPAGATASSGPAAPRSTARPGGTAGAGQGGAASAAEAAPAGVARSGVECGPGVRQVPWSAYAPPCVPAFTGDNGGSTSHGVTGDTIVVTYRKANSAQDTAVYSAAGDAAPAPDPVFLADMRAYIDVLNQNFELYGRKVVLKDYQGQGDYVLEDHGQGQDAAQADAATAYDLGAFADLTFFLKGSQPYWSAVAQKKIVGVGPLAFPDSWFQRNSPYWYSVWPSGSKMAQFIVNVTCRRLAGLPAVFAGDAAMHDKKRVFGLVTPENPEFMELGDSIENQLQGCGVKVEKRVSYTINVATFQAQSTNMVAQLKSAGVTSVLCYCDPLVPQFLSDAANQQGFRPEWVVLNWNDPQARLANQDEWAHAISNGGTWPKRQDSEAYRVFKLAHPDAEPAEQYFDVAYMHVLFLFTALQAAGPNLTPETLQAGLWSLPPSEPGVYGTWAFGPGTWSPGVDMEIGWWSPDATSNRDGKKGAWQTCGGEDGGWVGYFDPEAWGSPGTQLSCFGR